MFSAIGIPGDIPQCPTLGDNDRGEQGEKGNSGRQGFPGIKGRKGEFGIKGERGIEGMVGSDGYPGAYGPRGRFIYFKNYHKFFFNIISIFFNEPCIKKLVCMNVKRFVLLIIIRLSAKKFSVI
jgi:hypothetical protein